ncbi:MAG: CoA pyrophosphatase [Anaerolineales bacterium]|nr:CoA pyrophosphatase [Anaerolineales bacterium]
MLTEHEIQRRLADALATPDQEPIQEIPTLSEYTNQPLRPAAVLIPMLRWNTTWHVLFTRRNANLPEHSGQVSFPGGRADPGDLSPEETALREAYEEIGLNPQDVKLLGRLRGFITITNYSVTPVVGVIPWPYTLIPAQSEVTRIFTIPLDWLADPANHEQVPHPAPGQNAPVMVTYFKQFDGEVLWGASARITLTMLNALKIK